MKRGLTGGVCAVSLMVLGLAAPASGEDSPEVIEARLRDLRGEMAELQDKIVALESATEKSRTVDAALEQMGPDALPNDFRLHWSNGMRAKTTDGRISMKFGGRLMYDFIWIDDGDFDDRGENLLDGGEVRRARLYWEGTFWKALKFKWQYDFAGGNGTVKDLYLELHRLPGSGETGEWHLRGGHFKEPFSLNELTSSKYITFMERALPNVFVPGRNPGFMVHGHALNERMTFGAGVFKAASDSEDCEAELVDADGDGDIDPDDAIDCDLDLQFDDAQFQRDGDYAGTVRVTALPWYEKGKALLHVGGSYSLRKVGARYRSRPEAHLTERLIDTGGIPVDRVHVAGAEAAFAYGPFHCQGEYLWANNDLSASAPAGFDDPTFTGWYAQAGVFLTGESRPYKTTAGTWNRVKPKKNYGEDGGYGAVELAGRYSVLDLDDSDFQFGQMRNWTAALNWYLTPNVILKWNYIRTMLEDVAEVDGDDSPETDLLMMRLQVDF